MEEEANDIRLSDEMTKVFEEKLKLKREKKNSKRRSSSFRSMSHSRNSSILHQLSTHFKPLELENQSLSNSTNTLNQILKSKQQQYNSLTSSITSPELTDDQMELFQDFFQKNQMTFLQEVKQKLITKQYKQFLCTFQIINLPQDILLSEEGRYNPYHYIIIEGIGEVFTERLIRKQQEVQKQYVPTKFTYKAGKTIINNMLLPVHKYNPYTIKLQNNSTVFRFTDQSFNKYYRKIYQKQIDQIALQIAHHPVFLEIPLLEIKKYVMYFHVEQFKYHDVLYQKGTQIEGVWFILEGEVEIIKNYIIKGERKEKNNKNKKQNIQKEEKDQEKVEKNRESKSFKSKSKSNSNYFNVYDQQKKEKQVKIVKYTKKQIFGLESFPQKFNSSDQTLQKYIEPKVLQSRERKHRNMTLNREIIKHKFTSKVTSTFLKLFHIQLRTLSQIQTDFPILSQNIRKYLQKITKMHNEILQKNQKIVQSLEAIKQKGALLGYQKLQNLTVNKQNLYKSSQIKNSSTPTILKEIMFNNPKPMKKKKRKRVKQNISLEWWGLAQQFISNRKYKLPTPPEHNLSQKSSSKNLQYCQKQKQSLSSLEKGSISNKIQYLKRRLFEENLQELQIQQQNIGYINDNPRFNIEKQNNSYANNAYIPKLQKIKIRMLNIKPIVVNNSQKIKKKLISYAKNEDVFCDKLQLE